jgi:hypothetical protein
MLFNSSPWDNLDHDDGPWVFTYGLNDAAMGSDAWFQMRVHYSQQNGNIAIAGWRDVDPTGKSLVLRMIGNTSTEIVDVVLVQNATRYNYTNLLISVWYQCWGGAWAQVPRWWNGNDGAVWGSPGSPLPNAPAGILVSIEFPGKFVDGDPPQDGLPHI